MAGVLATASCPSALYHQPLTHTLPPHTQLQGPLAKHAHPTPVLRPPPSIAVHSGRHAVAGRGPRPPPAPHGGGRRPPPGRHLAARGLLPAPPPIHIEPWRSRPFGSPYGSAGPPRTPLPAVALGARPALLQQRPDGAHHPLHVLPGLLSPCVRPSRLVCRTMRLLPLVAGSCAVGEWNSHPPCAAVPWLICNNALCKTKSGLSTASSSF